MPTLTQIKDAGFRERLATARENYLDGHYNDCVHISVDVFLDAMRAHPDMLVGTRLDMSLPRRGFPTLGVTLADVGTPQLRAEYDGRQHMMSEAVCHYEYVLDALTIAGL